MIRPQTSQAGFTAVELLITLFIAAAFLMAGYQLFDVVIRDGADARSESRANNVAYDYLRRYTAQSAASPCTPSTPSVTQPSAVEGLSNVTVSVYITCPKPDTPALNKIEAVVTYGSDGKFVKIATYVDTSKGAAPNTSTTLNGLVAWWQLNGNLNSQVGTYPLTSTGTFGTANRTGEANKAIGTDGTTNSVTGSTSNSLSPSSLTLSLWVNPSSWNTNAATGFIVKRSNAATDGYFFGYLTSTKTLFLDCGGNSQRWNPGYAPPLNTWTHLAVTCTSGRVELFVNGAPQANRTSNNVSALNSPGVFTLAGDSNTGNNYRLNGAMDDVRIYNRVLTNDEILQVAGEAQ